MAQEAEPPSVPAAAPAAEGPESTESDLDASEDEFLRSPLAVLWFDAAQRWHKFPGQTQVRVSAGRLVLFEEGVLRASDVYTGRELWEVDFTDGSFGYRMFLARRGSELSPESDNSGMG